MNQADLLDQFVIEARECLEAIGGRLLEVERDPTNLELLNDLFRSVHTLKGNCGLFEFKPLERVVHAAEDLLDRVRNHTLDYSGELADALLEAMDFSAQMIDQIERSGGIDDGAAGHSIRHAKLLRGLLRDPLASEAEVAASPGMPAAASAEQGPATQRTPPWLEDLQEPWISAAPGALAVHYLPEAGCFFKGEDPWRLAATTPGLRQLKLSSQQAWPTGEDLTSWDCYQCNLAITLLTDAPRAEVEAHFRCVSEQVAYFVPEAPAAPAQACTVETAVESTAVASTPSVIGGAAEAALRRRVAALWADQCALLARKRLSAGAVLASRRALGLLLISLSDAELAPPDLDAMPESAPALLAWALQYPSPATGQQPALPAVDQHAAPLAVDQQTALLAVDQQAALLGGPLPNGGTPLCADAPDPAEGRLTALTPRADELAAVQPHKVLKVNQEKIDRLMELIGEMVVAKNSLPYLAQRAEEVFQQRELSREIKAQYAVINRIAEDLQHAVMQVRMLPVGAVFQRFGRLVRDISRKLGKEVNLVLEGDDTEADKNVIESLADPLIHILRNSLDHGIELPEVRRAAGKPPAGTIHIAARQESDRVIIEIRDDGAGIDPVRVRRKAVERGLIPAERADLLSDDEAAQLIFLPGFSTAEAITDLSGRGVGMDVVRTAIERVNGGVELNSVFGQGTTLRLSLPLSMAVTHVMVVESAGRRLGVPMDLIVETVRVHADDIHHFKQAQTTVLRGRIVPLRALNDLLALDARPQRNEQGELAVLVVRVGQQSIGLLVDQFHGASDIILKPLEGVLAGLIGFAGTALMGDGGVLMVLNPKELLS